MNKAIYDYIGFQKGLERIKYAGLLASQEEADNDVQFHGISEEVFDKKNHDEPPTIDIAVQIDGNQVESVESDVPAKNNTRRKPNLNK
jgi:hypothetical protein